MITAIRYTLLKGNWTTSIDDFKYFEVRKIENDRPQPWSPINTDLDYQMSNHTLQAMERWKTVAFLVAKDGELIYERYFSNHEATTLSNSFSMAKSVVTLLLGCAIEDGYIPDLETKVKEYFSEYNYPKADELTVGDLARMSSGMDWQEEYYLPINVTTQAYYGHQLPKLILSRKIITNPGQSFKYLSGNTQLLAMVLDKVLPITLSEYLSEKLWKPMGMEMPAKWMIDPSTGIERSYCCINASARDFLKIGQLLMQKGTWNGRALVPNYFIEKMSQPYFSDGPQYGYGLWMDWKYKYPFYLMRGHLGQYVIVLPEENIVIARLGKRKSKVEIKEKDMTEDIYIYIDGVMDMMK